MLIKNALLSWPSVFSPQKMGDEGHEKYSVTLLIDEAAANEINLRMKEIISQKWTKRPKNLRFPLRPAQEVTNKYGEPYEGFEEGKYALAARNKEAPRLVDRTGAPVTDHDSGLFVPGDTVNAIVDFWAYDYQSSGITCSLLGLQWVEHGDPIGSKRPNVSFEALDETPTQGAFEPLS